MNEVRLASNLDARYWMQKLAVSRTQLEAAVREVGTRVESVVAYLDGLQRQSPAQD